MNKAFNSVILILSVIVLSVTACRTQKGLIRGKGKVENLSTKALIDSIGKHCFSFEYFNSRISTEVFIEGEGSKSFKTHLKIRSDSCIWLTLSVANIVGASALVTVDSIKFTDKIKKEYFTEAFSYINETFGTEIDYHTLQEVLIGNLVYFDADAKYKTKEDTAYYIISTVGKRKLKRAFEHERVAKKEPFIYRYYIHPGTYRPARMIINDLTDSTELDIEYLSYEYVDSLLVPAEVKISASSPRKKAVIELKYSRTKVNEFTEFPFKIPDGYKNME